MYIKLADSFYLVHDEQDFTLLMDKLVPVSNHVMDDLKRAARAYLNPPTEYPSFITFSHKKGPCYTPVMQAIGSLSEIHLLDFTTYFDSLAFACKNKQLDNPPRLMLNVVTIKERVKTKMVGGIEYIVHSGRSESLNAMSRYLQGEPHAPKSICIKFGDNNLHSAVETHGEEYVFVTQTCDITGLVASIDYDNETNTYVPTYVFNHHNFLSSIPELERYTDTRRWVLSFSISLVITEPVTVKQLS